MTGGLQPVARSTNLGACENAKFVHLKTLSVHFCADLLPVAPLIDALLRLRCVWGEKEGVKEGRGPPTAAPGARICGHANAPARPAPLPPPPPHPPKRLTIDPPTNPIHTSMTAVVKPVRLSPLALPLPHSVTASDSSASTLESLEGGDDDGADLLPFGEGEDLDDGALASLHALLQLPPADAPGVTVPPPLPLPPAIAATRAAAAALGVSVVAQTHPHHPPSSLRPPSSAARGSPPSAVVTTGVDGAASLTLLPPPPPAGGSRKPPALPILGVLAGAGGAAGSGNASTPAPRRGRKRRTDPVLVETEDGVVAVTPKEYRRLRRRVTNRESARRMRAKRAAERAAAAEEAAATPVPHPSHSSSPADVQALRARVATLEGELARTRAAVEAWREAASGSV